VDPEDPPDELDPEPDEPLLPVEYFVDVLEPLSWRTSVPKSEHSSHTSSSAPSTFTVFGEAVSAPHISHWTMSALSPPRV
jgi:hypothetical protein